MAGRSLSLCLIGCKERGTEESNTQAIPAKKEATLPKRGESTGEEVRRAAKDATLPVEIRDSAVVLERILNGERVDPRDFDRACGRLLEIRSEATRRIWTSMLLAAEAGMPGPLPTKEAMITREKLYFEGKVDRFGTEPSRFLTYLSECVATLTGYDMPDADREVAGFMKRFEIRFGSGEVGSQILENLKIEISHAKKDRETGAVPWKQRAAAEESSKDK